MSGEVGPSRSLWDEELVAERQRNGGSARLVEILLSQSRGSYQRRRNKTKMGRPLRLARRGLLKWQLHQRTLGQTIDLPKSLNISRPTSWLDSPIHQHRLSYLNSTTFQDPLRMPVSPTTSSPLAQRTPQTIPIIAVAPPASNRAAPLHSQIAK